MRFGVGQGGYAVSIDPEWRVIDVGSGHAPHPRANVLLEKHPTSNEHRSGDGVDASDPRLVLGDALDMPFAAQSFDFAIASHIAEHVADPARFCVELMRVAPRGYIETPGWLADMLLREPFHIWRVRRQEDGLRFEAVTNPRPLGLLGDAAYAIVYLNVKREGHRTLQLPVPPFGLVVKVIRKAVGKLLRSRRIRGLFYTSLEWSGSFPVYVQHPVRHDDPGRSR
jgi:hypothetical protein